LFRGGSRSIRPGSVVAGTLALALVLGLAGVPVAAPHAGVAGPLADSIRTLLAGAQGRETGLLAISLDRGDTLAALHAGLRLIPGSSAKLLTTSAYLHRFGPAARCTTTVEARGRADRKSGGRVRLRGDLILRGSGSPDVTQLLSPGSRGLLDSLAFLLRSGGLERFEGTLWVDGTLFAVEPYAPSWALEDVPFSYGAPVNAIMANGNAATLVATAGPKGVSYAFEPPEVPLVVESSARVGAAGESGWLEVDRRPFDARLRVRGVIPPDGNVRKQVSVSDPDSTAGLMLLGAMRRAGIDLRDARVRVVPHAGGPGQTAGSSRKDGDRLPPAPTSAAGWDRVSKDRTAIVTALASPRAAEVVGVVNAISLNAEAEALLRLLDPAPREKHRDVGLREARRFAAEVGVDTLDLSLVDGSGLSPQNLLTARSLVRWLWSHARDTTLAEPFHAGLATPGALGTLKNRFAGIDPRADLRAKTGTLTNVSALAGYVRSADGERIAFAMITNGSRGSVLPARQTEEELVGLLSRYRRGAQATLSPPPTRIPR
jgi:D-alanyl-D-alanine carboxypeptidase/D-alanyl-D-alanine-endopeptidase (penicillin-binding protein 4)